MLEKFELDAAGVREVLRGDEVRNMVNAAAEDIRARVRAKIPPGTVVEVRKYTTDRGSAVVVIADPLGMGFQARDGVFTRSVAEHGAEFKAWGG